MKILSLIILLLIQTSAQAQSEGLTLGEFLSQVKAVNPSLGSAAARSEAFSHRVAPAGSWQDPFVAFGVEGIPFEGEDNSSIRRYQLSQSVPFPGKLAAKEKIAKNQALSSKNDFKTLERQIMVFATQAYYRAYYVQEALAANERIRELVRRTMESTKARYQTGGSSHHDWLLAKVELSILEVERLRLLRDLKTAYAVLNELRNQPPKMNVGSLTFEPSAPSPLSGEKESLLSDQPELALYGAMVEKARQEERLARLSYFPDLVFQGMVMEPMGMNSAASSSMLMGRAMDTSWGVMVGVNIPLFFYRKQSELVDAAVREKDAALLEMQSLENSLQREIVEAKEQLRTAQATVRLYREAVIPATELAMSNAKTGYAARRLPLSQMLETARSQRAQELEYTAAQIDVELAKTRLQELLSSPPVLKLAPARPTLFGSGMMGGASMSQGMSGTINMGSGMSGPTRSSGGGHSEAGGSSGMEGM